MDGGRGQNGQSKGLGARLEYVFVKTVKFFVITQRVCNVQVKLEQKECPWIS